MLACRAQTHMQLFEERRRSARFCAEFNDQFLNKIKHTRSALTHCAFLADLEGSGIRMSQVDVRISGGGRTFLLRCPHSFSAEARSGLAVTSPAVRLL